MPSLARRILTGRKSESAASTRAPSVELHALQTRSVLTVPPIASGKTCSELGGRSFKQKIHCIGEAFANY
jgi:hypothetical protein